MKISSIEYSNPHARVRREQEDVILAAQTAYKAECSGVETDFEKIKADWTKLRDSWRAGHIKEKTFISRAKVMEQRLRDNDSKRALATKHQDTVIEAHGKLLDSYRAQEASTFDKMRGLCAYLVGSHKDTPAIRYLHAELCSYRDSTDPKERSGISESISSIFNSAAEFKDNSEVPTILADLEKITDPEQRTAFYRQNREAIHHAFTESQIANETDNS